MRFVSEDENVIRYKMDYEDYNVSLVLINYGMLIHSRYNYIFSEYFDYYKVTSVDVLSKDKKSRFTFDMMLDDRLNVCKIIFTNSDGAKRVIKVNRFDVNNLVNLKGVRRYNDLVISDGIVYPESIKIKYYGNIYYYNQDTDMYLDKFNNCMPKATGLEDNELLKMFYDFVIYVDSKFNEYFDRKHKRPRSINVYPSLN